MRRYLAEMVAGLLLVALALGTFGRVCGYDFVNYDDSDYVTDNRQVQSGLTRESMAWAFTTTHSANWHPLTWLSLELDHQLYGMKAGGYHLTNLLLHTANTLLLFLALRRMTGAVWRSAVVAALFAVHPLHVESVAWVSERKDVLSTLFWMLTLLAYAWYAERPAWGRYFLVLLSFALGLLAKPMLVTLPCVLLLLDYWPLRRVVWPAAGASLAGPTGKAPVPPGTSPAARPARVGWLLLEKLPLFALTAASCAVTLHAQRFAMHSFQYLPIKIRCLNALTSYAGYIGKMFCPLWLAALYPYPHEWSLAEVLAAGALLLAISGLALWTARRRPYLLVGWLWYLGTLVPVIGLVQVGKQQMADRYTYIPLIGLFVLLVWAAADLLARVSSRRALPVALSVLVLLPCVLLTWRQTESWRDAPSLWNHALDVTTDNSDAHICVGSFQAVAGKTRQAIAHYRQALAIAPNDSVAHYHMGAALATEGKTEEAVAHLTAAVRLDPRRSRAHLALGEALSQLGRLEEARQVLSAGLEHDPKDAADLHNSLGIVCGRLGKPEEAARHFAAALQLKPDLTQAHSNLGSVLAQQGDLTAAVEHFSAALRADPKNAVTHYNLGKALALLGRRGDAAEEYRVALRLQPDLAPARAGLEGLGAPADQN
jgi:Flp pilus assembly protein TadD